MKSYAKIVNGMMEGDIDSYNIFKDKVIGYIDSHFPEYSDVSEDIFENIVEELIEKGGLKNNYPAQFINLLINRNVSKYKRNLLKENEYISELIDDVYYTEDVMINDICKEEYNARIHIILDTLYDREKNVLKYRFLDNMETLENTGKHFGVSKERIRQIEAKALRKLRHPTRGKWLLDFMDLVDDDPSKINNDKRVLEDYSLKINLNHTNEYYKELLDKRKEIDAKRRILLRKQLDENNNRELERFLRPFKYLSEEEKNIFRKAFKECQEKLIKKRAEKLKRIKEEEEKLKRIIEEREKRNRIETDNYIRKIFEEKKRKLAEEEESKESYLNSMYNNMINQYMFCLKEVFDLIEKILNNTEGHRSELYHIIIGYAGIGYEEYKAKLIEFYIKYGV